MVLDEHGVRRDVHRWTEGARCLLSWQVTVTVRIADGRRRFESGYRLRRLCQGRRGDPRHMSRLLATAVPSRHAARSVHWQQSRGVAECEDPDGGSREDSACRLT